MARFFKLTLDDDSVDRLSRLYTVILLICFGIVVGTYQLVGSPINCWTPAHFTSADVANTNNICWTSNTFHSPTQLVVDSSTSETRSSEIYSYHRRVPLILLFLALMVILIPRQTWCFISKQFGVNLPAVMDAARRGLEAERVDIRQDALLYVTEHVDRYLLTQRPGCVLMISFLAVKLIYFANAIAQLFILGFFLNFDYQFFGIDEISRFFRGSDSSQAEYFPRSVFCDFKIRKVGTVHNHSVNCELTINELNAKVFLFIWFWNVFVAIITLGSALLWLALSLYWPDNVNYLRKHLRVMDSSGFGVGELGQFARNYLRQDGMFIVRLVGANLGEAAAREVVCGLWKNYSHKLQSIVDSTQEKSDRQWANLEGV